MIEFEYTMTFFPGLHLIALCLQSPASSFAVGRRKARAGDAASMQRVQRLLKQRAAQRCEDAVSGQ